MFTTSTSFGVRWMSKENKQLKRGLFKCGDCVVVLGELKVLEQSIDECLRLKK